MRIVLMGSATHSGPELASRLALPLLKDLDAAAEAPEGFVLIGRPGSAQEAGRLDRELQSKGAVVDVVILDAERESSMSPGVIDYYRGRIVEVSLNAIPSDALTLIMEGLHESLVAL